MSGLHAKLLLQGPRGCVKEIRRVQLGEGTSWAEFRQTAQSLFEVTEFDVTYQDPEGDWVAVSSDVEWSECVHLCLEQGPAGSTPLLRVAVRMHMGQARQWRMRQAGQGQAGGWLWGSMGRGSGSDEAAACADGSGGGAAAGCARQPSSSSCEGRRGRRCGGRMGGVGRGPMSSWGHPFRFYDRVGGAVPDGSRQQEIASAVAGVMETVGMCGEQVAEWLQSAVSQLGDEIDVNVHQLAACLHKRGLLCLERGEFGDAFQLFQACDRIAPSAIAVYNAACSQALLGQLHEAMSSLEAAVARGYNNVQHIVCDEDLRALHSLPSFHELIARLMSPSCGGGAAAAGTTSEEEGRGAGAASSSPSGAGAGEEAAGPPAAAAAAAAASVADDGSVLRTDDDEAAGRGPHTTTAEVADSLAQLCSMGFGDRQLNLTALRQCGGRVREAVEILLAQQ